MEKLAKYEKGKLFDEHSSYYRFQCDCFTPADAMDVTVDSWGNDDEHKAFTVTMYFVGNSFIDRVKHAFQILRGNWCWREFIVREDDAQHLSDIFDLNKKYSELP